MKSKGNKKRKLIDSPYESDIYSHCLWKTCLIRKYIHSDIVFSIFNDEVPSISSQIIEQLMLLKK